MSGSSRRHSSEMTYFLWAQNSHAPETCLIVDGALKRKEMRGRVGVVAHYDTFWVQSLAIPVLLNSAFITKLSALEQVSLLAQQRGP